MRKGNNKKKKSWNFEILGLTSNHRQLEADHKLVYNLSRVLDASVWAHNWIGVRYTPFIWSIGLSFAWYSKVRANAQNIYNWVTYKAQDIHTFA